MAAGIIRLDYSSTGIVIVCAECPWWSSFRFHKDDAWDCACAHEELVHPEDRHQRDARDARAHHARQKAMQAETRREILTI